MIRQVLPPEIWIQIFRFATSMPATVYPSAVSSFDPQQLKDLRKFGFNYFRSLRAKSSISLVCNSWRYLVFPFLWEIVCLLPGKKYHIIGSILQRYNAPRGTHQLADDRRAGDYVRAIHVFEPENGYPHELFDIANIQRIIRYCPNLVTLTAPEGWQLFTRHCHVSFQPSTTLHEVHLSLMDEETIQKIFARPERLLLLHGTSLAKARQERETVLPAVHTLSMRPSDMEYRNIFAPSLSRWVIHDTIVGLCQTRAYQRHATLITSLELACTWRGEQNIQSALSGMSNLQELAIHLDTMRLVPAPYSLPVTVRRLGLFCCYEKHGWVLDTNGGTFRWFLDRLGDWLDLAIRMRETLELLRFLDWKGVRLPKRSSAQRRSTYSEWWAERFLLFEQSGIKLQNQDGNPLGIEITRGSNGRY